MGKMADVVRLLPRDTQHSQSRPYHALPALTLTGLPYDTHFVNINLQAQTSVSSDICHAYQGPE